MDVPKTDARPNNSISVTVREPSSMREMEPRHTYMAKFLLAIYFFRK